eukprot:2229365-Ditylum_brightwellii.AAC.1
MSSNNKSGLPMKVMLDVKDHVHWGILLAIVPMKLHPCIMALKYPSLSSASISLKIASAHLLSPFFLSR